MRHAAWLAVVPLLAMPAAPRAEILWDRFGVPHVFAPDPAALHKAFGYAQMESHADLILRLYGEARGRAAEYWGKDYRDGDRWVLINDIPGTARSWLERQKPEYRAMLDAFTAGMNAYAKDHPEKIDPERRVVLPLTTVDVLAHSLRVIHFSFVARPDGLDRQGKRWAGETAGSNAWAIGPKRSASGRSLLVANPHLPWDGFFLFYEAHLVAPGVDFYGTTLVGNPSLSIGFNRSLGWTHTVNTHDGADLYELELAPGGYRFDGNIQPFEERRAVLKVRQSDGSLASEPLTIQRSVHGPVVREKNGKALALRIAGLDQPFLFEQYWQMARAGDFKEWEQAVRRLQMPMFTTMYADKDGHIYHLFGGRTPVRPKGDWNYWAGIVPGNTSETLWTRTHAYEDLPKWLDPPSGYLQNANDPPWTTTFPSLVDRLKFPPYMAPSYMGFRPQRSTRMLEEDASITFDEAASYKLSTRMETADRMLDELLAAAGESEACRVLANWDRNADNLSRGAVLFSEFFQEWMRTPGGSWKAAWDEKAPWKTPRGIKDPAAARKALDTAAARVLKEYGALDVAWGDVHRLRTEGVDLPSNGATGELGVFRVTNYQRDPDRRLKAAGGDSFVAIIEFGQPQKARALLSYGNSSQPGSRHRTDQLPYYSRKELRAAWLTRSEIERNLEKKQAVE